MTDSKFDPSNGPRANGGSPGPGEEVAPVESIGTSGAAALAERLGVGAYELQVVEVVELSPAVRRLRVGSTERHALKGFSFQAGQDLMIDVGRQGERVVRRRYTIRRFDPERELLELDFVLHGDGPAARWAAQAVPGTRLVAIGPRGKVTLDPDARWHLFIGDETFVPAVGAMLDVLPERCQAVAVLEVDSAADSKAVAGELKDGDGIIVRLIERTGQASGEQSALLHALDAIEVPTESRHAYVAGEHHVVAAIRQALSAMGLAAGEVSPKAYWRLGQANAEHGEPAGDR